MVALGMFLCDFVEVGGGIGCFFRLIKKKLYLCG
jgi:hypothetical protein